MDRREFLEKSGKFVLGAAGVKSLISLGGCGVIPIFNGSYAASAYATFPYDSNGQLIDPAFATGPSNREEAVLGFPGRRDYESLFLFFDNPLGPYLRIHGLRAPQTARVDVNLIYSQAQGDVVDSIPLLVRGFEQGPNRETKIFNLESALQEFNSVRGNPGILEDEINTLEIRNYGPGELWLDAVEN